MNFDPSLYLVTDSTYHTTESMLRAVEQACRGGVTMVQLREKDESGRSYLALANQVKAVTDHFGIPLIIDDRVDIARACDAAGVHVGATDLPVGIARRLIGPEKIVGATAKTVAAARTAFDEGASYLGTGAIFPTTTHVTTKITSVSTLDAICRAVPIPVVAIGGLNAVNLHVLQGSPIAGIAVVSAIMKAEDPRAAAAGLRAKVRALLDQPEAEPSLDRLPNIGKVLQQQLRQVGITSYAQLAEIGSCAAWLKIQQIDPSACIQRLQGLEGAIQGVKKVELSAETKDMLKNFYNEHKLT